MLKKNEFSIGLDLLPNRTRTGALIIITFRRAASPPRARTYHLLYITSILYYCYCGGSSSDCSDGSSRLCTHFIWTFLQWCGGCDIIIIIIVLLYVCTTTLCIIYQSVSLSRLDAPVQQQKSARTPSWRLLPIKTRPVL